MKVVLAEKPSVARGLEAFLHAGGRYDGYFDHGPTGLFVHLNVEGQSPAGF